MTPALRPEAVADVRAARDIYAAADPALSVGFGEDLDRLLTRLVAFPRSARPVEGSAGVRRVAMRRFPFAVFYALTDGGDLVVLRVLHVARSPGRWP